MSSDPSSHGAVPVPDRIVLVGFMAAGKSTVGGVLAERLEWDFVDFDDAIAARAERTPGVIIREDGEAAFRRLEAEVTEALAGRREVVLAPGGGWATRPGRAESLGPGTVVVWLRLSAEEAVRRAEAEEADRPLLGPPEGRVERMTQLLRRRTKWYAAAEVTVDVEDRRPEEVADEIVRRLGLQEGGA